MPLTAAVGAELPRLRLPPAVVPAAEPLAVRAVAFLDQAEEPHRLAARTARLVLGITLWESVIGMAAMREIELVQMGTCRTMPL